MENWFPKILHSEYISVSVFNNAPYYPYNQQKIPATVQNKQMSESASSNNTNSEEGMHIFLAKILPLSFILHGWVFKF
jgi:hypothetical protein